ncbi:MAG: EAL domain-containing protein [Gammaproteobacteria bacterium]|nr:EAL domain-containing protein [Gammaproteobacteria bacterium]
MHVFREDFIRALRRDADAVAVERDFGQMFESRDDGTQRVLREYFAGAKLEETGWVEGIGGFISSGTQITPDLKRRAVLALTLLAKRGPSWRVRFPNLYVSLPEKVSLDYWPAVTWTQNASAELDLSQEEWFYIADPAHNPERKPVWTGIYYDAPAKAWMVSCEVPIDLDGRHVATVGTDILLDDLFKGVSQNRPDGTYDVIFRSDGRLIADEAHVQSLLENGGHFMIQDSADPSLRRIYDSVVAGKDTSGILNDDAGDRWLAYTRLQPTDWYFVTIYPRTAIRAQAAESARMLFTGGVTVTGLGVLVMLFALRRLLLRPLAQLEKQASAIADGGRSIQSLTSDLDRHGEDEIGRLATAFGQMAEQVFGHTSELENLVEQRTRAMRESEAQFRALFEETADALLLIDGNRFVECNQAAVEMMRMMSREQLLETHPWEISPELQPDGRCSKEKANEMISIAKGQGSHRFEWVHTRADGENFPVEVLLTPIRWNSRDMVHVVWRDITERKQSELHQQLAAKVFESTREGIIITDPDRMILAVNRAFYEITGYCEQEVLGRRPDFLMSTDQRPGGQGVFGELGATGHWQGESLILRKSGEAFPALLSLSEVRDQKGETSHYVGLFADISDAKEAEARLEFLAYHDALTRLPNRLLLIDRLKHAVGKAERSQTMVAVLFLDLDRFKHVNDSLGHAAGDQLLQYITGRIHGACRDDDTLARIGGDEFVLVMEDLQDASNVAYMAERMIESLGKPFRIGDHDLAMTISIGISIYPTDGNDVDTLLRNADAAMYQSKERGRNTFNFYTQELTDKAMERIQIEEHMRRALENDELQLHYQPQISLASGRLAGAEALVRWNHPEWGMVPPSRFIPVIEESGLIVSVGEWVLRSACAQASEWLSQGHQFNRIAVNIAGPQLQRADFLDMVCRVLADTGLSPNFLELEITETFIMGESRTVVPVLEALRELGIQLAIDDFGIGNSSLAYLKKLPIDRLKIDRAFVSGLPDDEDDAAIARSVIGLAHAMELEVIAEGVETTAQCEFLLREGCDEVQGYLYGKPMPASEFLKLMISERQEPEVRADMTRMSLHRLSGP